MSLKDWIKKVEGSQLNETAQTIMVPSTQPGSSAPGKPVALTVDTSKPGGAVASAALGIKPGQSSAVAGPGSAVKAVIAPGTTDQTNTNQNTNQTGTQNTQQGVGNQAGLQEGDVIEADYNPDTFVGKKGTYKGYGITQEGPHQWGISSSSRKFPTLAAAKRHVDKKLTLESGQLNESALAEIISNHPHEHKMCQEGWGMDNSLFEALADHYFKEGRIPRSVWHGSAEGLREFVESCYAKDTMVIGEGDIDEGLGGALAGGTIGAAIGGPAGAMTGASIGSDAQDMLDEEGVAEGSTNKDMTGQTCEKCKKGKYQERSQHDDMQGKVTCKCGHRVDRWKKYKDQGVAEGSKEDFTMNARQADPRIDKYATNTKPGVMNKIGSALKAGAKKLGGPDDDVLRKTHQTELEEMSSLERSLRQSTKENTMYEGKKTRSVAEATEKTKTGLKHKADAGGYGRKDDEADTDEDGKKIKKVAKDEPKKGRGRPKKTDNASGEDKKFDFGALSKTSGSKAPKSDKWDKKKTTSHKIATKADREEIDEGRGLAEGETIEKKGGRIHKGSYGTSHEAGDEGVKKVATQRGRGRPKKDADDSGEVKNYDWSAFGAKKGVKLPAWDKKKTTSHKIATKADREEVDEAKLKGGQKKLDINKNGKLDKADFSMLSNQKKKKDVQMESWDSQLKGLLTEGITVSTSVGQEGGQDSVSITASDHDAHQLLQMLQNAGMGTGMPAHAIQAATAPSTIVPKNGQSTSVGTSNSGDATDDNIETPAGNVSSMPMPRGMAFSVQPEETEMPTEPEEFGTLDQEEVVKSLGTEQSSADDNGDGALAAIKKLMGAHGASEVDAATAKPPESKAPTSTETEYEVDESDEDGKKPDEDGDGVPDWADKKKGEDDNAETDAESDEEGEEEKKKVEEGKDTCNECGGLMEDDHECGQLNEWSNSPQGQSEDEQFESDMAFMTRVISGGLNGEKRDQTVMPHTQVKVSEGYNIDVAAQMKKLAGIR